jgi:hypothetical protein
MREVGPSQLKASLDHVILSQGTWIGVSEGIIGSTEIDHSSLVSQRLAGVL